MKLKISKIIAICSFLTLLVLPNIVMLLDADFNSNVNNPLEFVKEVKSEYETNFVLKPLFLNGYLTMKSKVLKDRTLPHKAFEGNENWWFLGNDYNNTLDNAFGLNCYTKNQLNRIKNLIHSWHSYLENIGVSFFVVMPPNKNIVYREQLAFQLIQKKTTGQQVKEHLGLDNKINFIDLTESIITAKSCYPTFIKTDTHWNDYGAFIGYNHTMEVINTSFDFKTENLSNYNFNYNNYYAGDIPKLINSESYSVNLMLRKGQYQSKNIVMDEFRRTYRNTKKSGNILVYHDSFMLAMMPFINETFGEVNYIKSYQLNTDEILKHKPDILILELVERNLDVLLKLKKPLN